MLDSRGKKNKLSKLTTTYLVGLVSMISRVVQKGKLVCSRRGRVVCGQKFITRSEKFHGTMLARNNWITR